MWILLIVVAILLILLFYPLRVRCHGAFDREGFEGKVILHPFFARKFWAITLWDSEAPSKEKKVKKKTPPHKAEKIEKESKELTPATVMERMEKIFGLLKNFGRGIKHLKVKVKICFHFVDPAYTGRVTGAIYAAIPLIFGNLRRCRWRILIEPDWYATEFYGKIEVDATVNLFDTLLAFGNMLPQAIRYLRTNKKKKGGTLHERTSY